VELVWQFYCAVCNRKCQAGGVVLIDLLFGSQTLVVLAANIGKYRKNSTLAGVHILKLSQWSVGN